MSFKKICKALCCCTRPKPNNIHPYADNPPVPTSLPLTLHLGQPGHRHGDTVVDIGEVLDISDKSIRFMG